MKKTLKQQARDKVKKQKATVMFWDSKGTASVDSATAVVDTTLHKVRQSINQKVERSEEDVKKRFNEIMIPFLVFQVLNFLLLLNLVVR